MEVFKEFTFEAAHHLPLFPHGHKCQRLHGHSFRVVVGVGGYHDPETGIVLDFGDISKAWAECCGPLLDHQYLNKVEGLDNPTAENIAVWIWEKLRAVLPTVHRVEVRETCTSGVVYMGWARDGLRRQYRKTRQ